MKSGNIIVLSIILAVTLLSFANTTSFDFIVSDEEKYVVLNQNIRDLSLSGIARIFLSMDLNLYTPLTVLSFAVDYALWGLNPAGFHAVNLILHLLNTSMVFLVCIRLTRNTIAAGIAACLFGVHPVHVESVAWIAERKDLLFTFFALGALLLYDIFRKYPGKHFVQAAGIIMFLCSLLAKPQAVALPLVLFFIDYFYDDAFDLRLSLRRIWPYAAVALIACCMTVYMSIITQQAGFSVDSPINAYAWWNRPFLVTYSICFYIVKLFWPFNLTAWYACPDEVNGMLPYLYYLSAVYTAGLFLAAWWLWKRWKRLVFGIFFFLLMLLPVLQIIPFGLVIVAERYAYMSSIGIFLITGQAIAKHIQTQPASRNLWFTAIIIVISGLAWLTYERNKDWKNSETLYSDIIARNPCIANAYNNRGAARYHGGDYAGAVRDYDEALRLDPNHVNSLYNRGMLCARVGDANGAIRDYSAAIAANPYWVEAYHGRGQVLEAMGDIKGALRDYSEAIRINPGHEITHVARGALRNKKGQYADAMVDFDAALRLNPYNAIAYKNRGVARYQKGDYAGAGRDYDEAIRLDPGNAEAYFNRAIMRTKTHDLTGALSDYNTALVADPRHAGSYQNRGLLLQDLGDLLRAERDFSSAIAIKNDYDSAYLARGTLKAGQGQYEQALIDLKHVVQLNPTNAVAFFNMGKIYLALSNKVEAGVCFENARKFGLQVSSTQTAK
ncbi:MAG: tetratricopeptide repeat protein [Kiritimatiellia bacterium]